MFYNYFKVQSNFVSERK